MEVIKEKLIKEYKELDLKIAKLENFMLRDNIDKEVGHEHYGLLICQLNAMKSYKSILDLRLELLGINTFDFEKIIIG